MLTLLLLATLGQTVEIEAQPIAESPPAVWIQPIGTIASVGITAAYRQGYVGYLPLGINFNIGATEVAAELSVISTSNDPLIVDATFGPVIHSHRGTWVDGFFLQPKVRFEAGFRVVEAQAALDMGYQFRKGHVYVAFVIGGGVGYGIMPSYFDSLFGGIWPLAGPTSQPTLTVSVNMNLLRIGYQF